MISFANQKTSSLLFSILILTTPVYAQNSFPETVMENGNGSTAHTIFDDNMLLDGYTKKYKNLSKEILLAMIEDDDLTAYKSAAAIRVFKENFSSDVVSREKKITEKTLLRKLHQTTSPFVQVEIMDTLCRIDRYKYFKPMVPILIQKLDHYNLTVSTLTFNSLNKLTTSAYGRSHEARVVFNALRKNLYSIREDLDFITKPDEKLAQKLKLLRWSIKILGNQELKKLPQEAINLL